MIMTAIITDSCRDITRLKMKEKWKEWNSYNTLSIGTECVHAVVIDGVVLQAALAGVCDSGGLCLAGLSSLFTQC